MKKFTLRFPEETETLYDAVNKSAQKNHRSLNGEILRAIEFYLKSAPEAQSEVKPGQDVATAFPRKRP